MACHVRDLTPESQSPSPEPLPSLPCSPPSATRGSGEGGPSPGTWDFFGIIQPGCLALPLSAVASHLLRDQPPPPPPVVSGSVSQSPWLLVDFGRGGGGRVLGLRHLGNDIKRLSFMQHFLGPFLEHSRRLVLHSMCLGKCRSRERSLGCRWAGT